MLMRALLCHDIAPRSEWGATGFHGGDAAVYKLERAAFDAHLARLATIGRPPELVSHASSNAWLLTFDDVGASAMTHTAPALEARNWRGHFFMTVGQLGAPEFLDARRDLLSSEIDVADRLSLGAKAFGGRHEAIRNR